MSDRVLFHVTWADRRRLVERMGLRADMPPNWANRAGEEQGIGGVVYLSDNLTQSVLWAGKAQYDFEAPTVIVAVRVEGDLEPDPHWQNAAFGNSWLVHRGHIPADDIVGFVEMSPDLLRAAVRREELVWDDEGATVAIGIGSPSFPTR